MSAKFNVEHTEFDLDTFQQILEAMDGYYVLPWFTELANGSRTEVYPWALSGMPDVSVDVWRYHVGFAIDRGFVECWKPDAYEPRPDFYYDSFQFEQDEQIAADEIGFRPRHRGNDVDVSSGRRPARLTYSGKEFVDNIGNPSVKAQAVDAVKNYGVPVMMELVKSAALQLLQTGLGPVTG
jgi:hypothetical protein